MSSSVITDCHWKWHHPYDERFRPCGGRFFYRIRVPRSYSIQECSVRFSSQVSIWDWDWYFPSLRLKVVAQVSWSMSSVISLGISSKSTHGCFSWLSWFLLQSVQIFISGIRLQKFLWNDTKTTPCYLQLLEECTKSCRYSSGEQICNRSIYRFR